MSARYSSASSLRASVFDVAKELGLVDTKMSKWLYDDNTVLEEVLENDSDEGHILEDLRRASTSEGTAASSMSDTIHVSDEINDFPQPTQPPRATTPSKKSPIPFPGLPTTPKSRKLKKQKPPPQNADWTDVEDLKSRSRKQSMTNDDNASISSKTSKKEQKARKKQEAAEKKSLDEDPNSTPQKSSRFLASFRSKQPPVPALPRAPSPLPPPEPTPPIAKRFISAREARARTVMKNNNAPVIAIDTSPSVVAPFASTSSPAVQRSPMSAAPTRPLPKLVMAGVGPTQAAPSWEPQRSAEMGSGMPSTSKVSIDHSVPSSASSGRPSLTVPDADPRTRPSPSSIRKRGIQYPMAHPSPNSPLPPTPPQQLPTSYRAPSFDKPSPRPSDSFTPDEQFSSMRISHERPPSPKQRPPPTFNPPSIPEEEQDLRSERTPSSIPTPPLTTRGKVHPFPARPVRKTSLTRRQSGGQRNYGDSKHMHAGAPNKVIIPRILTRRNGVGEGARLVRFANHATLDAVPPSPPPSTPLPPVPSVPPYESRRPPSSREDSEVEGPKVTDTHSAAATPRAMSAFSVSMYAGDEEAPALNASDRRKRLVEKISAMSPGEPF